MSNSSALPGNYFLRSQSDPAVQRLIRESLIDACADVSPAILWLQCRQPKGTVEILLRNQNDKGIWGDPNANYILLNLGAIVNLFQETTAVLAPKFQNRMNISLLADDGKC
ncbi:hypothetical protein NUACC21_49420 [Scytonema sp. NUACC21]